MFSHVMSEEVDAEERYSVLKEDCSGFVCEALSWFIVVISENDALEAFNFFENFLPELSEVSAMRRENAVTFLIESEPVEDALSDDECIVLFALESVETERSVA